MYGLNFGIIYGKIEDSTLIPIAHGEALKVTFQMFTWAKHVQQDNRQNINFLCYNRRATHKGIAIAVLTDFHLNNKTQKTEATCISLNRITKDSQRISYFNSVFITGVIKNVTRQGILVQIANRILELAYNEFEYKNLLQLDMLCLFKCFIIPVPATEDLVLFATEIIPTSQKDPSLLESLDVLKQEIMPSTSMIDAAQQGEIFKEKF